MSTIHIPNEQHESIPLKGMMRKSFLVSFVLSLLLVPFLSACSRNPFPSGEWEHDDQSMMGQMVWLYNLKSDQTGTVLVTPPALMLSSPSEATINWSYTGNVLTVTTVTPITIGSTTTRFQDILTLISQTDSTIIWKDQTGKTIEWDKKGK